MRLAVAEPADLQAWLALAAQVEHLFGPMVNEPGFLRALSKNMERGSALCVREGDGPPGSPIRGGLLFSAGPPRYTIGWLAVAEDARRQGIARLLVTHMLSLVQPPAEVDVTTFGADELDGAPARRLYQALGFRAAELVGGPNGEPRQVYRRVYR